MHAIDKIYTISTDRIFQNGEKYTGYCYPCQQIQFRVVASERDNEHGKPQVDAVERNQTNDRCQGCVVHQPKTVNKKQFSEPIDSLVSKKALKWI